MLPSQICHVCFPAPSVQFCLGCELNPQCWGGHVANSPPVAVWHGMLVVVAGGNKPAPAHQSFTFKNLINFAFERKIVCI